MARLHIEQQILGRAWHYIIDSLDLGEKRRQSLLVSPIDPPEPLCYNLGYGQVVDECFWMLVSLPGFRQDLASGQSAPASIAEDWE
jgi:hypothetical protein